MATSLTYPTGVRPLLIEETARRRRVEARAVELLEAAGFAEVIVPIIDYADPYSRLEPANARRTYRFIDREGELIALRSDFTPTVARALAPSLSSAALPLRVFYRGDVIRFEATRLGAGREMFQIGAELIGDASPEADAEMMQLATSLLRAFGVEPLVVYNDLSLLDALADAAGNAEASQAVVLALTAKQGAPLQSLRESIWPDLLAIVERLAAGAATLDDLAGFAPTATVAARLRKIGSGLDDAIFALHLDDFDEPAGYYTGLRFRAFGRDGRTPLLRGGRYDALYQHFGPAAPAFGFTITVDDLD
jgi:ATP phosphoribosyltransferase regulatory subunit